MPSVRLMIRRAKRFPSVVKLQMEGVPGEVRYVRERTCCCTTQDNAWCFACSACGKGFPRYELHIVHNGGEINYCPNCGAKVVSE